MTKPAMQILMIEDNELDALLLEEILSQDTLNSFEFTLSERLDSGLETLHRHEFDAILLDLGLPDSQGLETFVKVHIGILSITKDGQITDVNTAALQTLGSPSAEATKNINLLTFPPLIEAGISADFQDCVESARPVSAEHPYVTKWGKSIIVKYQLTPVLSPGGKIILVQAIMEDITERKRAEETLHESEQQYRELFEMESDALFLIDNQAGQILEANGAGSQLYGYSRAELLRMKNTDLSAEPEKTQSVTQATPIIVENLITIPLRWHRKKDGTVFPIEITGRFFLHDGRPVHIAAIRDITERKRAEEILHESEERFRTLIEQSSEGIALVGEAGNILEWNRAMEQITGILQTKAAHLPVWDIQLQMIPSEYRSLHSADSIKTLFSKALQTGNLPQLGKRLEVEIQTTSGERKTVTQTIFTIKTAGGYRIGSIVLDITERKHAEEALQQANQNLRLSYDATIEGWSNALDLRDKETEGHTQRVIDLTMELAREMGISEADWIHVRRGALLHDIGKMGVPDHILLKPDELTDEEWQIMRQHPVYAYNLLSRIDFLRPALDIPRYHHEKWDGFGYPDGLKGEQIPLAARIFAIVDVWDALISDRPYRKAWSEKKALDYICKQSGQYFDPKIVEKFLKLISKKTNTPSSGM